MVSERREIGRGGREGKVFKASDERERVQVLGSVQLIGRGGGQRESSDAGVARLPVTDPDTQETEEGQRGSGGAGLFFLSLRLLTRRDVTCFFLWRDEEIAWGIC